jgi:hypothetical protein
MVLHECGDDLASRLMKSVRTSEEKVTSKEKVTSEEKVSSKVNSKVTSNAQSACWPFVT